MIVAVAFGLALEYAIVNVLSRPDRNGNEWHARIFLWHVLMILSCGVRALKTHRRY
jgi:hypothetical protein